MWHCMHIWVSTLNHKQTRLYCMHYNSVVPSKIRFTSTFLFLLYITSNLYLPIQYSVALLTLLRRFSIRAHPSVS